MTLATEVVFRCDSLSDDLKMFGGSCNLDYIERELLREYFKNVSELHKGQKSRRSRGPVPLWGSRAKPPIN